MSVLDYRFDSGHFGFSPRREEFRRKRETLLGARGWLTMTGEQLRKLMGDADDWPALVPFRPDQVLPDPHFLLVDHYGGQVHPLRVGLNTIGRLPSNDIVFEEIWVSRRHCALLVHAWGGCELHDLASRNGTCVNGRRIERPVRLASGDWLQICQKLLLFVSQEDYEKEQNSEDHPATACDLAAWVNNAEEANAGGSRGVELTGSHME